MLEVRLLGQFRLEQDGELLEIPSRPAQSLFAYLILHPGAHHRRERLAGILWPDSTESSARNNLRQALWRIRKSLRSESELGEAFILSDKFTLSFNPESSHWLDVAVLEQEIPKGAPPEQLMEALKVYGGELLPGFYDDWISLQRERLRSVHERMIESLLQSLIQALRWRDTLEWGERWIAQGGVPEPAYRALMLAHLESGDTSSAAAAYRRCEQALREELGVDPASETKDLYRRVVRGEQLIATDLAAAPPTKPERPAELPAFLEASPESPKQEPQSFVGRERELALLHERLAAAQSGQGQVAFITGEVGSGKSAMMIEFGRRAHADHDRMLVTAGECNALTGTGDPYLPFRQILGVLMGEITPKWSQGSLSTEQAHRLWASIPLTAQLLLERGEDLLTGFAPLATLSQVARVHDGLDQGIQTELQRRSRSQVERATSTEQGQSGLFDQYASVVGAISQHHPLIMMLDDLQWADVGSIDLLFHLGRRLRESRVLILGAFRPSEVAMGREGIAHPLAKVLAEFKRLYGEVEIDLAANGVENGRAFVDALVDLTPNSLDESFRAALFRRTGGNPLFTLELLRSLESQGHLSRDASKRLIASSSLNWDQWPARVEGVIAERLSRVGDDLREILNVACVEGEGFTAEVVAQVLKREPREVVDDLSHRLDRRHRLVLATGTHRTGGRRLSKYRFRHSLFQGHLYRNLDVVEREYHHEAIGRVLEALHTEELETVAVPLAWHFGEAGVSEKAVQYLYQAGEIARRMSAAAEAVGHLRRGLTALEALPAGRPRTEQELRLNLSLGAALIATEGYAAPEVEQVFERARLLCHQIGETPQLFPAIWGLWSFFTVRGAHLEAYGQAQQLLSLAQEDPGLELEAHRANGSTQFYRGNIGEARQHFEQGIELYDPGEHEGHAHLYGQNPLVACLSNLALTLWFMGFPDQARSQSAAALEAAEAANHPLSLAYALDMTAVLHSSLREPEETMRFAERAIAVSEAHAFPLWLAAGKVFKGWALAENGERSGLAILEEGLAGWRDTGARLGLPHYLSLLASAYRAAGNAEHGLSLIEEALQIADTRDEHIHESELYRLKGDLLRELGRPPETVAECYRRAVQLAREKRSRSMQLRALIGLCKLGLGDAQDRRNCEALARVYQRFDEGLETLDLQEARHLLSREAPPQV